MHKGETSGSSEQLTRSAYFLNISVGAKIHSRITVDPAQSVLMYMHTLRVQRCLEVWPPPLPTVHYSIKVRGCSMYSLNAFIHLAATAPSTVLWSELRVAFITLTALNPLGSSGASSSFCFVVPIARIHD